MQVVKSLNKANIILLQTLINTQGSFGPGGDIVGHCGCSWETPCVMQAVSDVKWSLKPGWQQHSSTGSALREEERGQQGQSNGLRETTQDTALVSADGPLSHKGHYLNGVTVSIWQISQKDWHIKSFYKMNLPVYNLCGKTQLTHSCILM